MDSQDRDETKLRQRQELLARRLGEALDRMKPYGEAECPDAEVIAAYAEQALGPAESAVWEGHFAACARCRKILRVLAASVDTPLAEKEVAQLGKLVSAVRAPVEITERAAVRARSRFVDWRARWLAPAIGVAAVLAVWFAMRPPWRATDRGASETLVAQAPKEEVPSSPAPAELDQFSNSAPQQQDRKTAAAPQPGRLSANAAPLNSPVETPAKGRADSAAALDKISPSADEARSSLQKEKKLTALPDARELQPPAFSPAAPPPPKAQAAMEAQSAPQSEAKDATSAAGAAVPQAETKADAIGSAASRDKQVATLQGGVQPAARNERAFGAFRQIQNYSSMLKAPSGSTLWRAGNGGVIERSTDAGKSWVSQMSPSQEDWLAGAAVSDTVCWMAGRNGAIARTMDGKLWERVSPPAPAAGNDAKLPDWTGITARDAVSATITANDGRKFATPDGGKTWRLQ
ncbi:MAG TPA: hypothetical protein VN976_10670 [Verrucomicrobiae bacterium]|nr:hypothetical protein [Verrucomicrobiae bacterium]